MGRDIHHMLEAKRALLLAISHELRSPLTRARLSTELLPETDEVNPQREALLRDLHDMTCLITDLLESERLAAAHTALQTEPVALAFLAKEVVAQVLARQPARPDAARTRSQGGVGLGLYLCKLVAQAHGGTFAVRNAQPGLAVTVPLPGP